MPLCGMAKNVCLAMYNGKTTLSGLKYLPTWQLTEQLPAKNLTGYDKVGHEY